MKTKISQGPIECSFIISDDERESNEFTQIYTIGEIFETDCMNDDIHVIGSVAIPSFDRTVNSSPESLAKVRLPQQNLRFIARSMPLWQQTRKKAKNVLRQ